MTGHTMIVTIVMTPIKTLLAYNFSMEICWTSAVAVVVLKKKMQKVKEVIVVKKVEEGVMVVRNSPELCLEMLLWLKLACKPGA